MRADGVRRWAIGIGGLLALGGAAAPAGAQEWTVQEIVDRAVARADEQRAAQADIRYRATVEELRLALLAFKRTYNEQWMLEKYDYRSPAQVRRDLVGLDAVA